MMMFCCCKMNPGATKIVSDLYDEMYKKMYVYALNNLDYPAAAEDLVQDTFVTACRRYEKFVKHPNQRGWLMQALKFNIKKYNHNMKMMSKVLSNIPLDVWLVECANTYIVEMEDDLDLLYGDLAKNKEYELVKKYALECCSLAELAQEYGISINCCKQRIFKARRRLIEILKKIE